MILITGCTGFLGQRLLRALAPLSDSPIRCLVRPGTADDVLDGLIQSNPDTKLEFRQVSFNDAGALQDALEGVSLVYHVAASMSGSFASMVANTVVGSDNLFDACVAARVKRLVLVSSFAVIGAADVTRRGVIDEETPLEPHPERRDPYAFSKHRQETLAWEYSRNHDLPLVVVRPGVIFGPPKNILGPRIGIDFFGLFLHLGGSNKIPLIYADNCAELIARSGLIPDIDGEIFCAVDDDLPTSRQLLRRYVREVKWLPRVWVPYFALKLLARINIWCSNRTQGHWPTLFKPYEVETLWKGHEYTNQKAKRMLGWAPAVQMTDALDQTFDYLKSEAIRDDSK